jgi:uncharacterized YccA/Bax inhibitor family protein
MMRTSHPALNNQVFSANAGLAATSGSTMTLEGTVWKTGVLLAILVAAAGFTWVQTLSQANGGQVASGYVLLGGIGGLICALVTVFKPSWSPYSAPLYAGLEGLLLGGISAMFETSYPGIALQAVGATFGTLAALLAAYASGLVRPTEKFKLGVTAATGGICLVYLASWVLSLFGSHAMGSLFAAGAIGIGFSVVVVIVAALNLVLDFDFIETGVRQSAPKYMEWYGAFGLLVTLVWLYLEILRLLSKLRSRN